MPRLKITLDVLVDGRRLFDFPVIYRREIDEAQAFAYEVPPTGDDTTFVSLPAAALDVVEALVVASDEQSVTLRLDGQTDAGILLNPGGLLVILGATIDAGATANVKVNNNSGEYALLRGLAAGA